jgi:hypothetical protein
MSLHKIEVWVKNSLLANDGLESIDIRRELARGRALVKPPQFYLPGEGYLTNDATVDWRSVTLTCSDAFATRVSVGDTIVIRYPNQPALYSGQIRTAYPGRDLTRYTVEAHDHTPYKFNAVYSALDLPAGVIINYWPLKATTIAVVDYLKLELDLQNYWPGRRVVLPSTPGGVLQGYIGRIICTIDSAAFDDMRLYISGTPGMDRFA